LERLAKAAEDEIRRTADSLSLSLDHRDWSREWKERFQGIADSFLGHSTSRLHRLLERFATEEEERLRACGKQGTSPSTSEEPPTLEKLKYMLCKLFDGYERVDLDREVSEGLGAGLKFFVTPVRGGRKDNPKLVKIGFHEDLRHETVNYRNCIQGYLDTFVGQLYGSPVQAGDYQIIAYSSVGYARDKRGTAPPLTNLSELVLRSCRDGDSPQQVAEYLSEIDACLLSRLYRHRATITRKSLGSKLQCNGSLSTYHGAAATHLTCHCGFGSLGEIWRSAYVTVLPPLVEYRVPDSTAVAPLTPKFRLKSSEGPNDGTLTGRVWKHSERMKADGSRQIQVDMLDPHRHRRLLVTAETRSETRAEGGVPGETKTIATYKFRYGRWLAFTVGEQGYSTTKTFESVRGRVCDAMKCKTQTNAPSPVYERLLDGPFNLGALPRGHLRPFDVLDSLLEGLGYFDATSPRLELPMTLSTIHGDLNLGNIMVGSNPRRSDLREYWLIDFEKTRLFGHLAYDFAKLEVEIRSHVVSRLVLDECLRWMDDICGCTKERSERARERALELAYSLEMALETGHELAGLPPPLVTAYSWIMGIRELALNNYSVSHQELRLSTFLYSMNALRFSNLVDPGLCCAAPFPLVLHYIAAGIMGPSVAAILEEVAQQQCEKEI
jgi:hypothetical protein